MLGAVQIIDNNMLMPLVVGNKIRINALAIISVVLVGGELAGVAGMFLAIPGIAVMKVIFERVKSLKPWATLLGDETAGQQRENAVGKIMSRIRTRKNKV